MCLFDHSLRGGSGVQRTSTLYYTLYSTPYSTHNHNMILFKLLIKLYATVLLLSTRTRCLPYKSSEKAYLKYRMYSHISSQSHIYRIFFSGITYCNLWCTKTANLPYDYQNIKCVFLGGMTTYKNINSSSSTSTSIVPISKISTDGFSSSSIVNYKYHFMGCSLYRTSNNIFIDAMIYRMWTSHYHHELLLFCDNDNTSFLLSCELRIYWNDSTSTSTRADSQWCNVPYGSVERQLIQFLNNNFSSNNNNDEFPFEIINMMRGVLKFNNNNGMVIKFAIS